jgi:pimeloyl-ACP methyl ester carboxylesterase
MRRPGSAKLIERATSAGEAEMKPTSTDYADVNGIKLYHEIYGAGEPLVLIHGGLTTIGEMQGWVQPLAKTWQVIAVEMQGHGRTADTDRPMSFPTMGDDIAALLDHLKIPKADLVGHSFGGASAIRAAIQHPEKVRRLVVISSPYARFGVPGGAAGHEPGRRGDGRKHDADTDGQVFEEMARAAALPAVPRQAGQNDERRL